MSQFHRRPNTFVGQVHLKVTDITQSLSFYQNVIGFQVKEQEARKATLSAGDKVPLLTLEQPDDVIPQQPRTTGLYHFALLLPSRSDLGTFLQHFIDSGHALHGASNHIFSEALYFADPDGNGIEVYADTPSSTWPWQNGRLPVASKALDLENLLSEAKGAKWRGLPHNTVVGHIHLRGSELTNMRDFYERGLGFDLVIELPDQALFFSTGGYHHHIAVNVWNSLGASIPPENSAGMAKYSLIFPDKAVRENAVTSLARLGFDVKDEGHNFLTEDPSGNRIQLLV